MGRALVGRDAELRSVLAGCRTSALGVALLGGAGIGKSRLLGEVRELLDEEGWTVVSIAGSYAAQSIPLGPVASLLPEDAPADHAVLISHVLRNLIGEPDARRRLLAVDDAHLLDNTTLALLVEVAHRRAATMVLTARTEETTEPTLRRLLARDGMRRVELGPLSRDEVGELAESILGAPLEDDSLHRVRASVRGNPLLLRELLADARDGGLLELRDRRWRLQGDPVPGVRLVELIRTRLSQLPADHRQAIELLAVAEPLDLSIAERLPGDPLPALEGQRFARLERSGDRWLCRTDHPLIGETIRDSMSTSRRLTVLRELCRLLTDDPAIPPGTAMQAVRWFEELGNDIPAELAASAAHQAMVALDADTAVTLAQRAAQLHWRAAFVLAELARAAGDGAQAATWFERAARLATDDASVRRVSMARAAVHAFVLQEHHEAIRVLREASERVSGRDQALELLCEAAFMAALVGQFDEVVRTCREVLGAPEVDALTTWTAAVNLGYAQIMLGDVTEIDRTLETAGSLALRTRQEHPEGTDLYSALTVGAAILQGQVPRAARTARERLEYLGGEGAHRGVTAAISVEALILAGDVRAVEVGREAVEQLSTYDPFNALAFGQGYAALAMALSGDVDGAQQLLREVDRDTMDVRSTAVVGRAECAALASQDPAGAATAALEAGRVAIDGSHVSLGVFAVWDAMVLHDRRSVAAELAPVCAASTSPLIQMIGRHASALASADPDAAICTAADLEVAEAPLLAATAFSMAAAIQPNAVVARRLAARRLAIEARIGWTRRPWTDPAVPDAPSAREIDVALLAIGSTNREVAEQLYLSTRTVGNHLQRLYGRLEVDGRPGLASVLIEPVSLPSWSRDEYGGDGIEHVGG